MATLPIDSGSDMDESGTNNLTPDEDDVSSATKKRPFIDSIINPPPPIVDSTR